MIMMIIKLLKTSDKEGGTHFAERNKYKNYRRLLFWKQYESGDSGTVSLKY